MSWDLASLGSNASRVTERVRPGEVPESALEDVAIAIVDLFIDRSQGLDSLQSIAWAERTVQVMGLIEPLLAGRSQTDAGDLPTEAKPCT